MYAGVAEEFEGGLWFFFAVEGELIGAVEVMVVDVLVLQESDDVLDGLAFSLEEVPRFFDSFEVGFLFVARGASERVFGGGVEGVVDAGGGGCGGCCFWFGVDGCASEGVGVLAIEGDRAFAIRVPLFVAEVEECDGVGFSSECEAGDACSGDAADLDLLVPVVGFASGSGPFVVGGKVVSEGFGAGVV